MSRARARRLKLNLARATVEELLSCVTERIARLEVDGSAVAPITRIAERMLQDALSSRRVPCGWPPECMGAAARGPEHCTCAHAVDDLRPIPKPPAAAQVSLTPQEAEAAMIILDEWCGATSLPTRHVRAAIRKIARAAPEFAKRLGVRPSARKRTGSRCA